MLSSLIASSIVHSGDFSLFSKCLTESLDVEKIGTLEGKISIIYLDHCFLCPL